ncbi:T9SS type A sorting domain-containing protein [bacterium]|nr:T9SS type A sorting domain-containing protein [bacterium]
MTRMVRALLLVGCLAATLVGSSVLADSKLFTETENLTFRLLDDDAYVRSATSGPEDSLLIVPFQVRYDSSFTGTLTAIRAKIEYNTYFITFIDAYKDSTNWAGDITYDLPATGEIVVLLDAGTATALSDSVVYFYLKFSARCELSFDTTEVVFGDGALDTYLSISGNSWGAPAQNRLASSVTSVDYYAEFTIEDLDFSGELNDTIFVPVMAYTNFRPRIVYNYVNFDSSKVEFAGYETSHYALDPANSGAGDDYFRIAFMDFSYGFDELDSTILYTMKFLPKCELYDGAADFVFDDTLGIIYIGTCFHYFREEMVYYDGSVTYVDSAFLKMVALDTLVQRYGSHDIDFSVQLKNSFPAGLAEYPTSDTGIIANVGLDGDLIFNSIVSEAGEFDFSYNETEGYVSLYQTYNGAKDNFFPDSSDFRELLSIELGWDSSGYAPSWNNRFICPTFVHDSVAVGNTVVPDTAECLRADSLNGRLIFWDVEGFDAVECAQIAMGEFSTNTVSNLSAPCVQQDLYFRTNIEDVDSFCVVLNCNAARITSVGNVPAGVQATKLSNSSYRFRTTSSFSGTATDTLVRIAKLTYELNFPCNYNHMVNVGVSLDSQLVVDGGSQQYVATSVGAATAKCVYAMCPYVDIEDRDRIDDDDPPGNLPIQFALDQNYPNPFNPVTTISLSLPEEADWHIAIFNVLGQEVKSFSGHDASGVITVEWNAAGYSSGVYLYRAVAGNNVATRKMLLLK